MERKTSLYDAHLKAGGKMVPFAGYLLPVQMCIRDSPWTVPMMEDLIQWIGSEEEGKPYRHLDWTKEMEEAKIGSINKRHWTNTQMRKLSEV